VLEPRIRVSAIVRWRGRILLCQHHAKLREGVWLLPGGGVHAGESLLRALQRELWEETGLFPAGTEIPLEGPVALVDSIAPGPSPIRKHVVHVIFATEVLEDSHEDVASSASCNAGSRAIRRCTSARCGCPERPTDSLGRLLERR